MNKYIKSFFFFIIFFYSGMAYAASISCGGCHSMPPLNSDSGGCRITEKSHSAHSTADALTCSRCHPSAGTVISPSETHYNNLLNITSLPGLGMIYDENNHTCTNACHRNINLSTWGGSLDCNSCHYRRGETGSYTMSGQHLSADRSFGHFSSSVKVVNNASTITCANCHPVNDGDNVAPRAHINATDFQQKANMSNAHNDAALTGVGYIRGALPSDATCTASCHYNGDDTFGNETTYFKPDLKLFYGPYQTSSWGSQDLRCNECHSLPSQEASFGGSSSINANKHHYNHMYKYKLALSRFAGDYRDIYCYDCHRFPNPDGVRSFKNHSTTGQWGSGFISLPIKSGNSKVSITWRNGNTGYDGINPPSYNLDTKTCDNVYCHSALTSATWTDKGCAECHGVKDGVLQGSGAPGYRNWTTATTYPAYEDYPGGGGAHYTHIIERGMPCRVCHLSGGKDGNQANHNQGAGTIIRSNVNVSMGTEWSFKGAPATYDSATRECANVNCHYGVSKNWDCEPLH